MGNLALSCSSPPLLRIGPPRKHRVRSCVCKRISYLVSYAAFCFRGPPTGRAPPQRALCSRALRKRRRRRRRRRRRCATTARTSCTSSASPAWAARRPSGPRSSSKTLTTPAASALGAPEPPFPGRLRTAACLPAWPPLSGRLPACLPACLPAWPLLSALLAGWLADWLADWAPTGALADGPLPGPALAAAWPRTARERALCPGRCAAGRGNPPAVHSFCFPLW